MLKLPNYKKLIKSLMEINLIIILFVTTWKNNLMKRNQKDNFIIWVGLYLKKQK